MPQIKYFQAVIRNNNFSQTKEQCHISQWAISQQIQSLQKELDFQLLQRKNGKFKLTPVGKHFYKKKPYFNS
ncbi:MAG TPA: LysR family transcriptional regulator [Candidatus Coprocola pullicola]|nr:LysR family transcriptional regulator [Candidatus Coprocola pullicola]